MDKKTVWMEFKETLEKYVSAVEGGAEPTIIQALAAKIKKLEEQFEETSQAVSNAIIVNLYRPRSVVAAFEDGIPN